MSPDLEGAPLSAHNQFSGGTSNRKLEHSVTERSSRGTLICVPGMCRRMLRRNVVSNRSPRDLVNVAVKLDMDSSFGRWICRALELLF